MVFSDSTAKDGLIQTFEFWTRMKDGDVTGTLLKQVTSRINLAFDNIMPLLLSYSDNIRWDDTNHTDAPIGRVDIVSGQNDYKITEDDNSLDILNITGVRILPNATDTIYQRLNRIKADDRRVEEILSPDASQTGTPSNYLELGNRLYLDILPNYAATAGIEVFFGREQSYFVSTDTTKEPGIPLPFHELLALYAALDWNMVNRTADGNLISLLQQRIKTKEEELKNFIDLRNPTDVKMEMAHVNHR